MHRRLTFQGDSAIVRPLADTLVDVEGVIGVAYLRDGALKPRGDLLQVDVLNRAADEVLRRARPLLDQEGARVALVISQTSAMIDRAHRREIEADADEAMWEEMESYLRNHGRVAINYLVLMALGGVIASIGLTLGPVAQSMALVAASIIAPGFEPISAFISSRNVGP